MIRRFFLMLSILALGLTFLAQDAAAWKRFCSNGTCAKWPGNCPVVGFYINPGFQDAAAGVRDQKIQALIRGIEKWFFQSGACFRFKYLGRSNITTVDTKDGKNVVFVRQASKDTALATCYASWKSNGRMNGFDVVFWDKNYRFSSKPAIADNEYDIWTVAAHEIGHGAGLDHSGVAAAILFPSIGSGSTKRNLSNDDGAGLRAIYGRRKKPPSTKNALWDFKVKKLARNKLRIRFKYRYRSSNGLPIRFSAHAYKNKKRLRWFGYGPPRITRRGKGTASVVLTYAYNNPPRKASIDGFRISMYTSWDRKTFYSRYFRHKTTVKK